MKTILPAVALAIAAWAGPSRAQQDPSSAPAAESASDQARKLAWTRGPASFALGDKATLKLPDHVGALAGADSEKFMRLSGNLPSPGRVIVAGNEWWAVFDYDDSGYVKDDEKIDADKLIEQIKSHDDPDNEERRKRGLEELHTDGWYIPPAYDAKTHNLEWAIKLHAGTDPTPMVNYTVRMLGRGGYERAVLVTSPQTLDKDVVEFRTLLGGFDFKSGEKYSEFRQGDKVAEYGLAALVAGGAAAVAAKTGLFKTLLAFLVAGWKLVVGAVLAVLAALGRLVKGRKGSGS